MKQELGIAGKLAHTFLNSKLTPLFIAASLAMGAFAIAIIPREEEPQILVPMLDITTAMPGASPAEVEERVTLPIENAGASDLGRRVCVLHVEPRPEPGDRALSGWHAAGRRADQGLQQALLELRPHAARSIATDHQGPLHRRCADPGADAVGRTLRRVSTSRHRGRDATQYSAGDRCLGDDDHRRPSAYDARSAQHREAQRVWTVADGHRRASAGRQCDGAGRQLCREQSGSPRRCWEHLHRPRRPGSCCSGRGSRATGVPARRGRADRRRPRRPGGLCGLRHNHRRRINTTAVSGSNHHRGQTQGHQRNRHCQRGAAERPPDAGRVHTHRT